MFEGFCQGQAAAGQHHADFGRKEYNAMAIGFWQVALILVIVLIIFGAGKLPKVMGDVAKGVKNFKEGMKEEDPTVTSDSPRTIEGEATSRDEAKV